MPESQSPKWHPLSAIERRVAGVLVEKAKTTPEAYPLTLNATKVACNQKNNRFPLTSYENDHVEEALERLRGYGVVAEIVGDSRVPKYRHLLYEWLGVDKVEMAVMIELLLRGAQTVGELRGRAARMEPIADLAALQPVLVSLLAKNLIVYLTPHGRGEVLTHNLYTASELQKLRQEYSGSAGGPSAAAPLHAQAVPRPITAPAAIPPHTPLGGTRTIAEPPGSDEVEALRAELEDLRSQFSELQETTTDLRRDLDDVKRQLGI